MKKFTITYPAAGKNIIYFYLCVFKDTICYIKYENNNFRFMTWSKKSLYKIVEQKDEVVLA